MKNLFNILRKYTKELEQIETELLTLPEGSLTMKGSSYYHVTGRKQICITKNDFLIRQLRRKKYLLVRKIQLMHNLQATSIEQLDLRAAEELIATFQKAYSDAPIVDYYHPETIKWLAKSHRVNNLHKENTRYAHNGIDFRSMSERVIAQTLEKHKLLYRYDALLTLTDRQISPDFIIKNPFTDETYILEHFGLPGDEKYARNMNDKMDYYLTSKIIPSENLITTYEYHIRDPKRISNLIENVIL